MREYPVLSFPKYMKRVEYVIQCRRASDRQSLMLLRLAKDHSKTKQ